MSSQQPNILPLKVLVISLGLVLVGCAVFVFAVIASRISHQPASAATRCPDATLNLNNKGKILSVTPQGDQVQITLANPPSNTLITADRCSGKILQTLTITP